MNNITDMPLYVLEFLALLFIFIVGLIALLILIVFIRDRLQTKDAIAHNYPVIGHFRTVFIKMGEYFRQYFFAMDREEMPFNRAERNWVYSASKNENTMLAFGSTKNLNPVGTAIFVSCPFPTLRKDTCPTEPLVIGSYCKNPYQAKTIFNISGMSYGSISKPALQALSKGAAMAGCWLNTGEGGLAPYHLEGGADIVFQIGTAKFGVRDSFGILCESKLKELAAHEQIKMFEIKLSQGAKPGKGGILPAAKVNAEIAAIRGIPEGKDAISPNRHLDIGSVSEILDAVDRVRRITEKPVGIKFVVGSYGWIENLFDEIYQRGIPSAPDFIAIDGGDGGTGASPMALLDNVGLPLRESLVMVADLLIQYNLKQRIRLIASGKLLTAADVAWALCVGADFINSARGFMFSLGCIQALRCHENTCPTGVATHKLRLQRGLDPGNKALRVYHYAKNMAYEVEVIAHSCGVHEPRKLNRYHVRIMQEHGYSVLLNDIYPLPSVKKEYIGE